MAILTKQQEDFAKGLFEGLSQRQAYKKAYDTSRFKNSTIDRKACEQAKNSKVMARLDELRAETAQETKWTVEKLINKFEKIHDRCMQEIEYDEMEQDDEGKVTKYFKFEHAGANTALKNIGELLGYYVKKVDANVTIKKLEDILGEED